MKEKAVQKGEIIKPTIPLIYQDNNLDYNMHPLLVLTTIDNVYTFEFSTSTNNRSILSKITDYELTKDINLYCKYINTNKGYIQTDSIFKLNKEEIEKCNNFAYISPNTKEVLKDIVASNYFLYNILLINDVVEYDNDKEELKNNYFYNDSDLYNNKRYKYLVETLLDRSNYISFIKEVNRKYNEKLDVDTSYYELLQEIKREYSSDTKNALGRRVA